MTHLQRIRWFLWLALILVILICAGIYGRVAVTFDAAGTQRAILAALIGAAGLGSVFVFLAMSPRSAWLAVMFPALLARLLLLPAAPGDDIYRYLWEGKLVELNVSPYAVPGDDGSRVKYRDANWQQMNHKDKLTAYPPLTLRIFSWLNRIHSSSRTYQCAFLLLDLFLIAVLLALLKGEGLPFRWAGFYALSPLSMIAFSAEAHFDILMVLPLVAAVLAHREQAWTTAAVLLGLAVGIKIMSVVAVPILLWNQRWNWRVWVAFSVALLTPLIPFWYDLPQLGRGILAFGAGSSFNGSVYQVFQSWDAGRHELANQLVAGGYVIIACIAWWRMKRGAMIEGLLMALGVKRISQTN